MVSILILSLVKLFVFVPTWIISVFDLVAPVMPGSLLSIRFPVA